MIGAGVGGLGTALALSRQGHDVTVLERDRTPLPHDPDEAFEWDRRGAPQVRHSHAMLARLRNLLRDRYPDVLEALYAAGVTDWPLTVNLPPTIDDASPQPGDDDLVMLACRRTTFEWVLRDRALSHAGVALRDGVDVVGLDVAPGARPRVVGARVSDGQGDTTTLAADLFVDASGPRGASERWLTAAGIDEEPPEMHETGIVYLSPPPVPPPPPGCLKSWPQRARRSAC